MSTKDYDVMEWTPERIRKYWDWQSQFPEQYFTYQFGDRIAHSLANYIKGRNILDYGCGIGALIPHLCDVADCVTATDISPESIVSAREYGHKRSNFNGAVLLEDLLSQGLKFETIISVEVIEHLEDGSLSDFLTNMRKLVTSGGTVIITTPFDENLEKSFLLCPQSGELFHRWQHIRSWNIESLSKRLNEAGFGISKIFTTDLSRSKLFSLKGVIYFARDFMKTEKRNPHLVCIGQPK